MPETPSPPWVPVLSHFTALVEKFGFATIAAFALLGLLIWKEYTGAGVSAQQLTEIHGLLREHHESDRKNSEQVQRLLRAMCINQAFGDRTQLDRCQGFDR